jgi:DNA-binding NarL/FixJ family response regulator
MVLGAAAFVAAWIGGWLAPELLEQDLLLQGAALLGTAQPDVADRMSRGLNARHRVLIADDHTIVREGLRALLESDEGLEVVAAVDNGRDAVRLVGLLKPDLALIDLAMPQIDGLSAIRELMRRATDTKIVVLTMHKTEEHIRASLEAGASGYVVKDASRSELLMAIRNVLHGKKFISPAVADRIVTGYLDGHGKEPGIRSLSDTLTAREKQVLKLIAEGKRNREIAEALFVSVKTVEKHRANLMSKLDLHNTAALTAFAIENTLSAP